MIRMFGKLLLLIAIISSVTSFASENIPRKKKKKQTSVKSLNFEARLNGQKGSVTFPYNPKEADCDFWCDYERDGISYSIGALCNTQQDPQKQLDEILEQEKNDTYFLLKEYSFGEWEGFPILDTLSSRENRFYRLRSIVTPWCMYRLFAAYEEGQSFGLDYFEDLLQTMIKDSVSSIQKKKKSNLLGSYVKGTVGENLITLKLPLENGVEVEYECFPKDGGPEHFVKVENVGNLKPIDALNEWFEKEAHWHWVSTLDSNYFRWKGFWALDTELKHTYTSSVYYWKYRLIATDRCLFLVGTINTFKYYGKHQEIISSVSIQ